jgi:transcriptional regulator of acetoin/glycerol metabolism
MHHSSAPEANTAAAIRAAQAQLRQANGAAGFPSMIEDSHQRSIAYGLSVNAAPNFSPLARPAMAELLEQNRMLHSHALPVMETLYEQIINTHNMVILTDVNGVIVHTLGDADFLEKADRVALAPGVTWSEQSKGTNAIGTALAEQAPTLVHADQHYLSANHFLTCSAAPIVDPQGRIIGVLDVSGDQRSFHKHTMALVRMSAQMIENQLFATVFQDVITLRFHARPEFIGTLMEGIVSFAPSGRFLAANRSALFQLGLPQSALHSHSFDSLFGMAVSTLFDHDQASMPGLLHLCLHSGVRVWARAELRIRHSVAQQANAVRTAPAPAAARLSSLRYLNTGDAQVGAVIDKVGKVLGRDIPIMVMGETGTGKELLAQAIHNDGARAGGPFVAVNCASIPESLIESELFGYEDGAFTGARKKGSAGKITQADGGTLFLDEIGDMPLHLQARLLRVLQERSVTPLGSTRQIGVAFDLVCATNRNLRAMIANGEFREDLYYRLNGLVVKLPPIRARSDLAVVIDKLLGTLADGAPCTVAPDVMALFHQHPWPGNFRQLSNLLRTASVMVDADRVIRRAHLPDDFLDEVASTAPARTPAPAGLKLGEVALSAIQESLLEHGGNVSAAAKALGVSRNTIYRKLDPGRPQNVET